MRRFAMMAAAGLFALTAFASLGIYWASQPVTLSVAAGAEGTEDHRLIVNLSQQLRRDRAPIRLKIVPSESYVASSQMLDKDAVDLAIIRSDAAMPIKGRSVAILHRNAAIIMAKESSNLKRPADLAGKKVGIVRFNPANQAMLERILTQYDVIKETVKIVPLTFADQAAAALKSGEVDAVFVTGPQAGKTVPETVQKISRAVGAPVFVPVMEADAIAQKSAAFESIEILRGAFGGTPPRPEESFTTLGFSHRLMAQAALDDDLIASLTRLIFEMRPELAKEVPMAALIEEPNTEKDASLPVHPGAAAYFNDEVPSFMDRYGDWFYIIVMLASVIGSGVAGMASYASSKTRSRAIALLDHVQRVVPAAREASTIHELDELDQHMDKMLAHAMQKAMQSRLETSTLAAINLGMTHARHVISQRRMALKHKVDEQPKDDKDIRGLRLVP